MLLVATMAIGQGVIKNLAQFGGDKVKQQQIFKTGLWVVIIASVLKLVL